MRGLLGTDPPDLTLESGSPSPPQGSIWHRFDTDLPIWPYFDAKSTSEEGRARRIRGWGPGGLCLINSSFPLKYHKYHPKRWKQAGSWSCLRHRSLERSYCSVKPTLTKSMFLQVKSPSWKAALDVPKPGCFKPGCLQFLRRSAILRSFALFCALLHPFTLFCALFLPFALFCALLRSFGPFCALLRPFAPFCALLFAVLICALLSAFACFCVRLRLERPHLATADRTVFSVASLWGWQKGGFQKGGFGGCSPGTKNRTRVHSDVPPERKPERGYVRMFPWTKTRTRVRSHVPPERKPERGYVRQNHPFKKPPFYLPVRFLGTIAATPPLLSVKKAYRSSKTGLGGYRRKSSSI